MSSIAVITDTDASLPVELAHRYGIYQTPINIHFGQDTLRSGLDIDDVNLFARVDRENRLPTTSAPSPGQFLEAFNAAFAGGADAVLCLCVSSAISATFSSAQNAREMLPDRQIEVVDTRSVSMAQGFMALAAAEAAANGASLAEATAAALDVGQRSFLYGALATLKYLAMSGRVGHVAAGLANVLNIKPVLTLRDGKLDLLERVRTRSKALERIVELTGQSLNGQPIERLAVLHVAAHDAALAFEAQLRAALPCPAEIIHTEMSPGLSVHTGAGMLGVAVCTGK